MRLVLLLLFVLSPLLQAAPTDVKADRKQLSVVRVNVTSQAYDFFRPWSKKAPGTKRALGVVIREGRVLVSAELVADATYLELEKAESGEKTAATVDVVDYEANLALIKPNNAAFLENVEPMELGGAKVGDRASIWQLEPTGALLNTSALVTTVEVSSYPLADMSLLIYRMTSSLQYREGSFVLPVVKDGKLAGMLMRYDPRSQNVNVIPAPVIAHFLKAAEGDHYGGFPRAGIQFAPMRDPQLRRYAGLNGEHPGQGVYITEVTGDGSAEMAGVKPGDVLLAVDDVQVDQDGNYADPVHGKISVAHLVTTKRHTGDVVTFQILREGELKLVEVKLLHKPVADYLVPPYVIDEAPAYYILGGLVLQELSRHYLAEWGNDWKKQGPQRLVYYEQYWHELFEDERKRLIILSQVLPSPDTIGYEQLGYMLVTVINDIPIHSLDDVAQAVKSPMDGFHKIEFADDPGVIYLDAAQVEANAQTLRENYGLPALHRGVKAQAEE